MVGAIQGGCSFVRTESTLNNVVILQSYSGSFKYLICHSISKCSFFDAFFLTRLLIFEFFLGGDTLVFNIQIKKKLRLGMLVQWKIRDLPYRELWFNSRYWGGGGRAREQIK